MLKKIVSYSVILSVFAIFLCSVAIADQPELNPVAVKQTLKRGCQAKNWNFYLMCGICRESDTGATVYFVFKRNGQFVNACVKTKYIADKGWIITGFDIMNEHPEFVFKKIKR